MQRIFHTPEGVRDIYSQECSRKQKLQEKLHRVFHQYGFEDIETPTFEYFEVFSKEVGTIPSRELYKFFDREGNTLVLGLTSHHRFPERVLHILIRKRDR